MDTFLSKLSLHDLLTILIPGCIIEYLVIMWLCQAEPSFYSSCCCCSREWNIGFIIMFLVIGYIIGLLNDNFMNWQFAPFRNNYYILHFTHQQTILRYNFTPDKNFTDMKDELLCCLMECHCIIIRYLSMMVYIILKRICLSFCFHSYKNESKAADINNYYYQAYYAVAKDKTYTSYSVVEKQVGLIRNIFLPLIILLFVMPPCDCCKNNICYILLVSLFAIVLLFTMFARQEKIYEMIWETYYTEIVYVENHSQNNKE